MRSMLLTAFAGLAAALATAAPAPQPQPRDGGEPASASDVYTGPLFSVHEHSAGHGLGPPGTWEFYLRMMDRHGISRMVVFASPTLIDRPGWTERQLRAFMEANPGRFVPFWAPRTEEFLQIPSGMRQVFSEGPLFGGSGEWGLYRYEFRPGQRSTPPDEPVLLELYDVVAEYDRTVMLHPDFGHRPALERALRHNREAVVYAHGANVTWHPGPRGLPACNPRLAGALTCLDVGVITELLQAHPNLLWDISGVTNPHMNETTVDGVDVRVHYSADLDSHVEEAYGAWRRAFEAFPDRFLLGWDSGGDQEDYNFDPEFFALGVELYRKLLGRFPLAIAEKIAYRNAERVILRIPTLEAPADGAELESLAVTLSWIDPRNTGHYHLQVRPVETDTPVVDIIRPREGSFTIPPDSLAPGGSFSWRVRTTRAAEAATDDNAHWRPWSAWRSFRIRPEGA